MLNLLGSTLGPYQILEQIGLGGMATVYKAYQPGMNRLVALKVLPEHYARDPRFVKRFEREAQVVAKLEHRNIIPIYDYGSHNNITYLAMRYLQAGTVKDILAHGALPLNDVAKLLSDIASALDYAHSQGIIHRDVKPSNVLVDKQGNAYLTDFGIAKVLEGTADFTGSSVLGTPTYMAPEQTLGKPATAQSDIYSLGVMLYEMVVGKPPYEADTPMAIALMHVHEPLPLPRKIKEDIPEAVELIILKALAKNPKDRFQTANDLARAFASALGAESLFIPSRLIELASGAAEGKGSEEVTYDIREEVKRKERTEKRKKLMRFVPIGMVIVLIVGLASALIWFSLLMQESQNASQRTATAAVFFAQTATESVSRLMATPGFNTAVAQIQEATRTQAAIETVMQSYRLTYAKGTQSVEETIIALTPTNTPTNTLTPTSTRTPTFTPIPTATLTPTPKGMLVVSALAETGSRFTAETNGIHRFMITSGAIRYCPPMPQDPFCGQWNTGLMVFKNRVVNWEPKNNDVRLHPSRGDGIVGNEIHFNTVAEAESNGIGKYIDIRLSQGEYVILIMPDCQGCFPDNSGSLTIKIDIIGP